MDALKERHARQRAVAKRQATSGGLDARRNYLRMVLRALDDAIEKSPDDDALKAQRTEVADDLRRLGTPSEREQLKERLVEVEEKLAKATGLTQEEMQALIATREQLITDLERFGK